MERDKLYLSQKLHADLLLAYIQSTLDLTTHYPLIFESNLRLFIVVVKSRVDCIGHNIYGMIRLTRGCCDHLQKLRAK